MFCNACGAEIQPQFKACPTCGRMVAASAVPVQASRLERHLRPLSILWIVAGALFLIPGIVLMTMSGFLHMSIPDSEGFGRLLAPVLMSIVGGSFLILAAAGILIGRGLLHREHWARPAAIILGILSLFHPPFGTALGIYTLWVILSDDGGVEYDRLHRPVAPAIHHSNP